MLFTNNNFVFFLLTLINFSFGFQNSDTKNGHQNYSKDIKTLLKVRIKPKILWNFASHNEDGNFNEDF